LKRAIKADDVAKAIMACVTHLTQSSEQRKRPQEIHLRFPQRHSGEYRRNIAGVDLLHCRELLLQSDQLIAKAKIICVPTAVFCRSGLLDLALMKRTPRAQMG